MAAKSMPRGLFGMKRLEVMDKTGAEAIHVNSLYLLENMGIKVVSDRARALLKDAGADVDEKTQICRIPGYLVTEQMKRCKRPVKMAARDPKKDFVLDGKHCYACTDGVGLSTIDLETGERRPSTKKDVGDSAKVVDYLPMMHMYNPLVTPLDVPEHAHTVHEYEVATENCSKHYTTGSTYKREEAIYQLKMAAAIVGGEKELKRRPIISSLTCTTSPLVLGMTTDAAIEFSRAGCPPLLMAMPLIGATAPMTVAGATLLGNAQVIAGATVLQLAAPGSPLCYSSEPMAMDVQTGLMEGLFPAANMVRAAHVQMAKYYDIPIFIGGWGSCSKVPDVQAGYEKAFSAFIAYLSGADMTSGPGLLENWTVLSYEQLIIDHEMFTMMADMLKGVTVNDDTLALETIAAVGQEGHFMGKKHTIDHAREMWQPGVTDGQPYKNWKAAGSKNAADHARDKAIEILKTHTVEPLADDIKKELAAIVKEAEANIPKK
ncbi:MAG TPA: trimethylamine methyltransferase family protein [Thermoplasmata archaeon]|nr:trimethylamine methyltransferase family protein [Thermoplasmata archaeon]